MADFFDVSSAINECRDDVQIAAEAGHVKRCVAIHIRVFDVSSVVDQNLYYLVMAFVCGRDNGGEAIGICRFHIGAGLDENVNDVSAAFLRCNKQ